MKLRENEVRIVDALFHEMAVRNGLSADESWSLFELGLTRIVTNDGRRALCWQRSCRADRTGAGEQATG